MLWCELDLGGASPLLVASVRNDSFDLANNLLQTRQLLARLADRPALLAGDFNAEPGTAPIELLRASGRFVGFAESPSWPADAPRQRIDHVLAPSAWTLVEQHTVDTGCSDHLAVVATFRLP